MTDGRTGLAAEIAKFDRLAEQWWDPDGPMKPLHRMNPVRMGWVVGHLAALAGRDPAAPDCLAGLSVLDVGCGAGLAAEWLARRGAAVVGVDASVEAIAAAQRHAEAQGLAITYRQGMPEDLPPAAFDAVLALEVIEHVRDRPAFLAALARSARQGGRVLLSTINRTPRSLLLAKFGAEYLLRWIPPGTHEWRMFLTPSELGALIRAAGLRVADITGMVLDPLTGRWKTSRDVSVNYMVLAEKP